jgi:hypothetical protein
MAKKTTKSTSTKKTPSQPAITPVIPQQQVGGTDLRDLLTALGGVRAPQQQVLVGIRNICGSTVGVPAFGSEPAFHLHPYSPTNPNSMAIISYPRWQVLRRGALFGLGLIERFDEIVDESSPRAPQDKPHECHPDHVKNRLPDPRAFIEQTPEPEMRKYIQAMTSENNLHNILGTVDSKVRELRSKAMAEGDPNPNQKALDELPMCYTLAEKWANDRIAQLSPSRVEEIKSANR